MSLQLNFISYSNPANQEDLIISINSLIENLKQEYEFILLSKHFISSNNINIDLKLKIDSVLGKLEKSLLKILNILNIFKLETEGKLLFDLNENIRIQYKKIVEKYNYLLLKIQNTIDISEDLTNLRIDFQNSLFQKVLNAPIKTFIMTDNQAEKLKKKIQLDKLSKIDNEIDEISMGKIKNRSYSAKKRIIDERKKSVPKQKKPEKSSDKIKKLIVNPYSPDQMSLNFKKLNECQLDLKNIKNFCFDFEQELNESCLRFKEKQNYENLKLSLIKLTSEFSIIKEDLQEFKHNLSESVFKLSLLERENYQLKKERRNLIEFTNLKMNVNPL